MRRLITIGPSHYCEKARWALDRAGLDYREERHPPVLHMLVAKRLGGGRTVPVLVTPEGTYSDSTDILRHVDAHTAPERRLFPEDPALRAEVEALEDEADERLGPHARRLAYFHLLDDPSVVPPLVDGVGRLERGLFKLALPLERFLMKKAMRIDRAGAERSKAQLEQVCATLAERLADGRRYLVGERFSAADLSVAALLAPLVWVERYGFPMPALETAPAPFQEEVARFREHPVGRFVARIYDEERGVVAAVG